MQDLVQHDRSLLSSGAVRHEGRGSRRGDKVSSQRYLHTFHAEFGLKAVVHREPLKELFVLFIKQACQVLRCGFGKTTLAKCQGRTWGC